jgi:hypothetical protein
MNRILVFVTFVLLVTPPSVTAGDRDTDNIRLVTTGEIIKIDSKKKTFEFKIILDAFPRNGRGYGGPGGSRSGRMGGRGPFPGRYPGGTRGRGNVQYIPTLEVKVFTSEKTTLKAGSSGVDFSIFRVGERVTVTGVHRGKGTDIDAIEVSRMEPHQSASEFSSSAYEHGQRAVSQEGCYES